MKTLDYASETKHGSIYDMGRESWWGMAENGGRNVPHTPDELRFEVDDTPFFEAGFIKLKGWIINESDKELELGLFITSNVIYVNLLENFGVKMKPYTGPPRPPPSPPPPTVLIVPPRCRIEIIGAKGLNEFEYEPGTKADLEWQIGLWHDPKPRGTMKVVLP